MTAPVPPSRYTNHSSQVKPSSGVVEMSFQKLARDEVRRRKWFAELMWKAFPGASLHEKALNASRVLDLTPKQCSNLMQMRHDPKLPQVLAVLAISGADSVFDVLWESENG